MMVRQLELGLENRPVGQSGGGRRRSGRANWWFQRMRGLVEEAREWKPAIPDEHEGPAAPPPGSWRFVRVRSIESD